MIANVSEALVYHFTFRPDASYLTPVFTLGICSFQIYQGEEKPTTEEIERLYRSLSLQVQEWLWKSDVHERGAHNWRRTPRGLRLIDYAVDPLRTSWAVFLMSSKRELNQATTKP
ncbi:MAG: hypothetical protein AAB381_00215 [Patescibacteria group bacterium]